MNARISLLTLSVMTAATFAALGGAPDSQSSKSSAITFDTAPSRWRFGAGYAPVIGLQADFSGLGSFDNAFTPQALGGGVDYNYDDGYVRVDSSGNLGGETWNWSYNDPAQHDPAGAGSIAYSLSNSLSDASARDDGSLDNGFETYAYFDMGAVGMAALKDRGATWGFRGGLHYARVDMGNGAPLTSRVETLTDRFSLGGGVAPQAPFTGSFAGPGPLIGDSPFERSISSGGEALVTGSRDLDVHLTTFNFGTFLEMPVTPRFHMTLEGGASAAIAAGSYDFQSETSITGLGKRRSSGSTSETTILPGLYLGLSGIYQVNGSWGIQAAGRFQYMDDFEMETNGSSAVLSFDSAFVLSLGALYSF
jgi:hypothetical protein